jgi:uracil-DNA glycosylase family 4
MNGYDHLKTVLQFYQLLGFTRLPFSLPDFGTQSVQDKSSVNGELDLEPDIPVDEALLKVQEIIGDCTRCKLHKSRRHIVFGEGSEKSGLMFIGEAPGTDEDRLGRPFVGRAGALLTNLISKMGLKREDLYIANVVKCHPPQNRNPEPDEVAVCKPFLLKQIEIIKPRVIITLGAVASQNLLETDESISELRGRVFTFKGAHVVPTFHPAYLLRNTKAKWQTWDDAQRALKLLSQS